MQIGPVQLVIVGFDNDDNFRGQIMRELDAVRGRRVIKLIDLLFIHKDDAGKVTVTTDSDATQAELTEYGVALRRLMGLEVAGANGSDGGATSTASPTSGEQSTAQPSAQQASAPQSNGHAAANHAGAFGVTPADVQAIVDQIPPGTAVAAALFEHVWAANLSEAIRSAGGHLLAQGILTRDAVLMIGQELEAIIEAEMTIEAADAIKGAALLDTLAFLEETEEIKAEAAAVAVEEIDENLRTLIAAQTLRTLIVSGQIDDSEVVPAVTALISEGLLSREVVQQALDAAATQDAKVQAVAQAQVARQ
jgi:hypothetical protein